jgi:hypothetical protein
MRVRRQKQGSAKPNVGSYVVLMVEGHEATILHKSLVSRPTLREVEHVRAPRHFRPTLG